MSPNIMWICKNILHVQPQTKYLAKEWYGRPKLTVYYHTTTNKFWIPPCISLQMDLERNITRRWLVSEGKYVKGKRGYKHQHIEWRMIFFLSPSVLRPHLYLCFQCHICMSYFHLYIRRAPIQLFFSWSFLCNW